MKEGWRAVQSSGMMVWFFAEGKQKSWKHCGRSGVCLGGHPERIVKENTGRKAWGQQGQYFSWFFQYLFFWRKYAHQEEHLLLQAAEEQHKQWQRGRSALPTLLGYSVTRFIFRGNQDIYQVTKLYCEMNSWLRGSSEQGKRLILKDCFWEQEVPCICLSCSGGCANISCQTPLLVFFFFVPLSSHPESTLSPIKISLLWERRHALSLNLGVRKTWAQTLLTL